MEDNTEHINKKLKPSPESDEDVDIKPMIPELNNIDMLTLPRICARCRIDFVDERNLRSHFLKYRNQASFSCELCHKSYVRADILQEHQRVHMNENLYKCVRCFYSCNQIYDIYEHMHTVHKLNIDTIFKCPYDDIVFRDSDTLFQHIGCHRVNVKQEKESRDNNAASETKVSGGKKDKVSGEENEERADEETDADDGGILPSTLLECNLDTRNLLEVVRKQTNSCQQALSGGDHTAENEPPPPPGHDKTSDLVDEVLDEIDKSTMIDVDYVKNDMVINTENYISNINSDDGSIRMLCYFKNIKCAYCTKVYIMKNDLKNHLVEDHDHSKLVVQDVEIANAEQFACTICNIKFDFAIDLAHHTNKEHTKYECEHCNKVYNQAYTLKKHMKTCTPETAAETKGRGRENKTTGPPICELCDKQFKRNWNLKQHLQKIHKVLDFEYPTVRHTVQLKQHLQKIHKTLKT
uniref:Zinc finger and SCAN domain-containing protein 5B n=2 Tax=Cacopsylla melanoneura TaxID=428564 RepID=A0A8D8W911_9HEMI